jgi:phage gp16-like protein
VTGLNKDLGLLKGENTQLKKLIHKVQEESARILEEALQRVATAEARAVEVEASLAEMKNKVTQIEGDFIIEREASSKLKTQLSEASSSSVKSFLGSNSFKYAAQFAVRDLIKYTIYFKLTKLVKFYPFIPEQLGFAVVDQEAAIPSDMSSFTWDESKDEMFDMEGNPVEKKPKIHSHVPTGIMHYWDPLKWPEDVNISEEGVSATGNVDAPGAVNVRYSAPLFL